MKRLALVTGGGRGIGRAIALALAKEGCDVAVNFHRSSAEADILCQELRELGVSADAFQADVSDATQVRNLFKAVEEKMASVSILVNNAGITRDSLLMRMKDDDWSTVLRANLDSAFFCTREAVRKMAKEHFGRIINITSVVGLTGNAGQANYSASKSGIVGFTKSVAREYAARGITVNAVAPGFIATAMTDVLKDSVKEAILGQIPTGRMGTPEDVANAVAFLAREESAYITGQVLAVDGGMTMC